MGAVFLLAIFFSAASGAIQVDEAGIRERAKKNILENSKYQRDLPFGSEGEMLREKEWKRMREFPGERERGNVSVPSVGLGAFIEFLLYGFLVVVVLLLVFWIIRMIRERNEISFSKSNSRGKPKKKPRRAQAPSEEEEVLVPEDWLAKADALASEGRYGEALHLLLLGTIRSLSRSARVTTKDSLTSRELLRRFTLADDRMKSFRLLVLGTERYLFGGMVPERGEFQSYRRHATLFSGKERR
jgi:hypothetical protein